MIIPNNTIVVPARYAPPEYHGQVVVVRYSRREKRAIRKKKLIPPSVWAERHRVLPADASIPGRWRNDTAPYLAGIMDASFRRGVEEIIICAAPQVGKSECINNCIAYACDRKPGNVMVVYPDELTAKDNSKDRLQPMFKDSPRLRKYLTGYADDTTSLRINLNHMKIFLAWANSAARLANKPLPYVVLDEEDKYPKTAGKREASPADLAKKRQRTFAHMRKTWRASSPSIEEGPIWQAFQNEAEVRFEYAVRCPECGHVQIMRFEQIKFPADCRDPQKIESKKLAWYECEKCSAKWNDSDRDKAVRNGFWRCKDTDLSIDARLKQLRPKKIAFHIPSWLSKFVSLSEAAAAFLAGLKDKTKWKDFLNGHKAVPWIPVQRELKEDKILALRDDRPRGVVPGGGQVACLLAGIDTQDDGFFYEIRAIGYGINFDSWCVREGFVTDFDALTQVIWHDEYLDPDGNRYAVRLALQDAMGHRTAQVYEFCRMHTPKIYPSQGKQTMATPFTWSRMDYYPGTKKQIPGGLMLVRFDTTFFKNDLSSRLSVTPGDPGAWYYHSETTRDWAAQMTAEGIDEKGFWINPGNKPNHAWDCATLILLGVEILGVKFWPRPEQIEVEEKHDKKQKATNKKRKRW